MVVDVQRSGTCAAVNRVLRIVKTLLPLATALALSVSGCTNSRGHAPTPVPSQQAASPVVMVVDYGIGAGDKRVEPTAFRRVGSGGCLAWHDLFSRGAAVTRFICGFRPRRSPARSGPSGCLCGTPRSTLRAKKPSHTHPRGWDAHLRSTADLSVLRQPVRTVIAAVTDARK